MLMAVSKADVATVRQRNAELRVPHEHSEQQDEQQLKHDDEHWEVKHADDDDDGDDELSASKITSLQVEKSL